MTLDQLIRGLQGLPFDKSRTVEKVSISGNVCYVHTEPPFPEKGLIGKQTDAAFSMTVLEQLPEPKHVTLFSEKK